MSGLTCPQWSCDVKLSSDGESYYVSQADADGVVRIVSIRRAEDGSLSVSAPWIVAAAEEGWRAFDVASTGPGRFLFAYERIDEALDASRIFTRVVTLAPF